MALGMARDGAVVNNSGSCTAQTHEYEIILIIIANTRNSVNTNMFFSISYFLWSEDVVHISNIFHIPEQHQQIQ